MNSAPVLVRPGRRADLAGLLEIYNHYVRETAITFEIEPVSVNAWRDWFCKFDEIGRYRLLVATDPAGGRLLGYAYSSRFRNRPAYDCSVEVTVYAAPGQTGAGAGTALYRALFDELADEDVHRVYAAITRPNPGSEAFHDRFGFSPLGVMTQVGRKFGRYHDVGWWEKQFNE